MDRRELIRGFIKEVLGIISRTDFPKSLYEKARRDYFLKKHKKSKQGMIRNKEIAFEALEYFIRIGRVRSKEDLDQLCNLPFFKRYAGNTKSFYDQIEIKESRPSFDLSDMSRLEYEELLHRHTHERVVKEVTADLEEERRRKQSEIDVMIEKKKKEYEDLPSVLEGPVIQEPDVSSDVVFDDEAFIPWWKRLHMISDPFPTAGGLREVREEFYNIVLYKTQLFNEFQYLVLNVQEEIMKNTIIFGEFGSGKTTLLEFIERLLWANGIPVLFLQIFTEGSIHALKSRFRQDLLREIKLKIGKGIDSDFTQHSTEDYDSQIIRILKKYSEEKTPPGIMIIIDDLHKNVADTNISLGFLNQIQTYTEFINRQVGTMRIAFLVAGALEWQEAVSKEPVYSGSFFKTKIIDDISIVDALTMLNLRLEPFWPNPELKREVRRGFVEREFNQLKKFGLPVTFRAFISRVVEKFKRGEFDILSSDPVSITMDTRKAIRTIIEKDKNLKKKFDNLLSRIEHLKNIRKTLQALIHVFLSNELDDNDDMVEDMRFHFQQLANVQLIQKSKVKSEVFKWVVCPELISANEVVTNKYQLSLESYLIPIFTESPKAIESTSEEIQHLENLIDLCESEDAREKLVAVKNNHVVIDNAQKYPLEKVSARQLSENCIESIKLLSLYYFEHLDPIQLTTNPIDQWRMYWQFPSETQQFLKHTEDLDDSDLRLGAITNIYRQTFAAILGFIINQVERSKNYSIESLYLTIEESKRLNQIQNFWRAGKSKDSSGILRLIVRRRLRKLVFNVLALVYGGYANRKERVPLKVASKIPERSSDTYTPILGPNEFSDLNLSDIAAILCGTTKTSIDNWEQLFSSIFIRMNSGELLNLLQDIEKLPNRRGFGHKEASSLKVLILLATEMLRSMNRYYLQLVTAPVSPEIVGDQLRLRLSVENNKELVIISSIPTKDSCYRLIGALENEPIPIDDPEFIESTFSIDYREFITILNLGVNNLLDQVMGIPAQLKIIEIQGPKVFVSVDEPMISDYDKSQQLLLKLNEIKTGLEFWREYEETVKQIMSFLYSSILEYPEIQSWTSDHLHRRDIIYSLGGGHPIWDTIRIDFDSRFVVIECKNSKKGPTQDDVEQLRKYLYTKAKRSIGVLCSRKKAEKSAKKARESIMREDNKLILFFSDEDLKDMLETKSKGEDPSIIIKEKIDSFLRKLNA